MTWPQRLWFNISLFLTLKVFLFLCIFTFQFQNEPQDKEASKTKWKEASSRRGKIHLHLLNLSLMTLPLVQKQRRAMLEMLRRETSDFQKVLCMKSMTRFRRLCRSRPRQERESRLRNVRAGPAPGGLLCGDSLVDRRGHDGEAHSYQQQEH